MTEYEVMIRKHLKYNIQNATHALQVKQGFVTKEELEYMDGYRQALIDMVDFLNKQDMKG